MKNIPETALTIGFSAAAFLLGAGCAANRVAPAPPQPASVRPQRVFAPENIRKALNELMKESYSDTQAVDVLYVTNRAAVGDAAECNDDSFGVDRSSTVFFGVCRLNVAKRHGVGGFEVAPHPRSDPHKYFRVMSQANLDENGFKDFLLQKRPADVLVFIHGFNVKFQEAVLRAAQIAYDLKFQGPVVLFSWPAGAGSGMLDSALINRTYESNRLNAANSIDRAAAFFKTLAGLGMTTHILVHSMGHQVVLPALGKAAPSIEHPFIGELILNAPDIPVRDFQNLAPKIKTLADRVTVYCSYNDNAIAASETYNKNRRLGGCERTAGIDVINVGEIDAPALGIGGLGHGYYASRPILTDIYQVLLGIEAEKRLFIRKSEPNSTEDFYLRP